MNVKTLAFIGPPGSGKGTQAKLAVNYLRKNSEREVLYIEMGAHFRELAQLDTVTSQKVKESLRIGRILPAFLATSFWADRLAKDLEKEVHLVIDGSPRSQSEALQLGEALQFYGRTPATMFYLPISESETRNRLADRKRGDDERQIIDVRLEEYHDKTEPAVAFCKKSKNFNLVTIDGEQTVSAIEEQIKKNIAND